MWNFTTVKLLERDCFKSLRADSVSRRAVSEEHAPYPSKDRYEIGCGILTGAAGKEVA